MKHWAVNIPEIEERAQKTRTLHLGCGKNKYPGAVGVDVSPASGADIHHDLDVFPYPFNTDEFDTVICINILEHLRDIFGVMREIHRICKPGAVIYILTPHFSDDGSYIDPTHLHHLSVRSFDYLIEGTSLFKEYGFYSDCRFKLRYRQLMLHRFFKFLEGFVNKHIALYEEAFCYCIRAEGIYLELEVVK